ncbi:MAG: hypothetical protein LUQ07_04460 [Methanospirillum sp.]|nr:hypothetical protein [Methanospirillum sp.]
MNSKVSLEKHYVREKPSKIKIGVSGSPRCYNESQFRDIGLTGTIRGWTIFYGGNGGTKIRPGDLITSGLSSEEAADYILRHLESYSVHADTRKKTARFIECIGSERLKSELFSTIPYIPLEKE